MGEDPDAGAAVEVFGLTSSFGEVHAVAGIDLRVVRAEASLPLLGPNGAGKDDDRLKFWRGYRRRDCGQVSVLGLDRTSDRSALKKRVGVVLQTQRWTDI